MKLTKGDILHLLLRQPVKMYLKIKFNIQLNNKQLKDIDGPFLLLGHHVTAFDPIISNVFSNRLIRYVAADANYDNGLKKILLELSECIPFSKNRAEIQPIRKILKHIEMGHAVGLYPEGGRNWDGATDTIIESTAKLIKLMNVPVYVIFYKGGYLSKPRWASYFRKGKIIIEIKEIFSKDIVSKKSTEELYAVLVDKLRYNEFEWQSQNKIVFEGNKLAEDIERLLYICPNCLAINSIKSKGDKFHCNDCHKEYMVNQYGEIEGCSRFTETASWNRWQRNLLPDIIAEGFSFCNPKIRLEKIDSNNGKRNKQFVQLTLSQEKIVIEYENKEIEIIYIGDLSGLSITFMDVVEFFVDKTKYRLTFNSKRHMSVKLFHDLVEALKEEKRNELRLECSC